MKGEVRGKKRKELEEKIGQAALEELERELDRQVKEELDKRERR